MLSAAQKGKLAVLRVWQRAIAKGWIVSWPTTDCRIDAVVAYVAPADTLVWLGPEHFHNRRNIQLRYAPTRSGQKSGCLLVADLAW